MNRPGLAIVFILFALQSIHGEPPTLEEAVGKELFNSAGLHQLSEEEKAALVEGLSEIIEQGKNPFFDPAKKAQRFGLGSLFQRRAEESIMKEPDSIQTRLVGEFRGWTGRTRFNLDNGQVWIQAEDDSFYSRKLVNPVVTLEKGLLGVYFLKVEGFGSRVKVKRLK